jgi:hypothetical protein
MRVPNTAALPIAVATTGADERTCALSGIPRLEGAWRTRRGVGT